MPKAVGVSDETYAQLAKLAEDADMSMIQVTQQLLNFAIARASIVSEVRLHFGEPDGVVQKDTAEPSKLPTLGPFLKKGDRAAQIMQLLTDAGRPLTAQEISKTIGGLNTTWLYTTNKLQRHGSRPVRFSPK